MVAVSKSVALLCSERAGKCRGRKRDKWVGSKFGVWLGLANIRSCTVRQRAGRVDAFLQLLR